jgi:histidinol phosphatase-like enzyme
MASSTVRTTWRGPWPATPWPAAAGNLGPGLLEAAAERLDLDLAASYLIGNHPTDLGAAVAAGVTPLFVATGWAAGQPSPPGADAFPNLEAAARSILNGKGPGPPRP